MQERWPADPLTGRILRAQTPVDGKLYRKSQFCFPFESQGRQYLFHTLTRQCVQTDGAEIPEVP